MSRSLLAHSALALARALKEQRPQHYAAVRSFSSWNKNTIWTFKDSTTGGSQKRPDEIRVEKESSPSKGSGEKQEPGKVSSQAKQLQTEQKPQLLPQYGPVHSLSTSSNNSTLIGGRKDSSGAAKEPPDKVLAEKKSNAEKLKSIVLEKPSMSPNVPIQHPRTDHVKKSISAGSKTSLVEIHKAPKLNDLQKVRTPEKAQEPTKLPSYPIQPAPSRHERYQPPHQSAVINWRSSSDKCGLFCRWEDSVTGGLSKPTFEIRAAKNSYNEKLKIRALENSQQLSRSPSVSKEPPQTGHVTLSTCAGSKASLVEVRTAKKLNDLQGVGTPEKTQEPTKPSSFPTQPANSEHERHHPPHNSAVTNWRTCSDKCGLFCRRNDSVTSGLSKPSTGIHAAKKSDKAETGRAPENSLEKVKRLSQVKKQTQNVHIMQHQPHHGAMSNWSTCSDKCGLFCKWKGSLSGASKKAPNKILVINVRDGLKEEKLPQKTQESTKSLSQSKETSHTDHVMSHSISRNLQKRSTSDSALQQRRKLDDWGPPPNEWLITLYAKESVVKENKKASEMIQQPTRSSSQDKQLSNTDHAMSRCVTRNLTRRSTSVSALRQRHSWDWPHNERQISLYANKSGSAPGSKPPGKPGAKAPDKPGAKAPDKAQKSTPEKTDGPLKRKFSKHVEMLLGRGEFSDKAKKDDKTKKKEGSTPGKGGKK